MTEEPGRAAFEGLLTQTATAALMRVLNRDGEETRLVGGVVRNALMHRPTTDIDLATTALPEEVTRRAHASGWKVIPTGVDHGTVTVIIDGSPFEVTTLREDMETDGRHAVVQFGRDFAADARRRDFTINALSVSMDGRVHDYCDGLADIAGRRVRFIGIAEERIREDYLRILRFFRFHAQYGEGEPDRVGLLAAIREREGLDRVSAERIRAELLKLMAGKRAAEVLVVMADSGFLTRIFGGAVEFGRLRRVMDSATRVPTVLRLAAFATMVGEDADRLRDRLRLSNSEHMTLLEFASLVERLKNLPTSVDIPALRRLAAHWPVNVLAAAISALSAETRPDIDPAAASLLGRYADGTEQVPVFPLRGADFVARGLAKGPEVGRAMSLARKLWLDAGCPEGNGEAERLLDETMTFLAISGRH